MDLLPHMEQVHLIDSVKAYLAGEFPLTRLHEAGAADTDRLAELAQMGWIGLSIPEEAGGFGGRFADEMLVFVEAGRHLVSPSLLATLLAARLCLAAGRVEMAGQLVSGSSAAAFAVPADGRLLLLDGQRATLGVAWGPSGLQLFAVPPALIPAPGFDETVAVQRIDPAALDIVTAVDANHEIASRARILDAAMLVGLARAACDMAVGYAKIRDQFGKPIGSFQAIKHRCADMAVGVEAAAAQTAFAAVSLDEGRGDTLFQSSAAKLLAGRVAFANAAANVQIHGAMGFTSECDAHLFVKRARVLDYLGGAIGDQRALVLDAPGAVIGDPSAGGHGIRDKGDIQTALGA